MLPAITIFLFTYFMETYSLTDYLQPTAFCAVGDTVQNRCTKCVCTSKHIYDCGLQNCPENIAMKSNLEATISKCNPNKVYVQNRTTCICNNKGTWPHERCSEIFGTLRSKTSKNSCKPNSYVTIDCNVCRCNSNGEIDGDRCTRNICQTKKSLNARKSLNIYGTCKPKVWYSLAPCQFCYCINENKLICNNGNYYTQNLNMGNYNLSICKGDLIQEAKELVQEYQNVLRNGEPNINIKSFKLKTEKEATTQKYLDIHENNELLVNVENDDKQKEIGQNPNQGDHEEESSESEEKKQENTKKIIRGGAVTQIPYQEYEDNSNDNGVESDVKENRGDSSDGEIGVDIKAFDSQNTEGESAENIKKGNLESFKSLGKKLGRSIKINIPDMFHKVLKTVLRKSMVSLKSDSKCEPGNAKLVKCNMCYCLKNGKLLCTENKCK